MFKTITNKSIQLKIIILTAAFSTLVTLNASADENRITERFRGNDPTSNFSISYDDYSALLKLVVLNVGRSTRQRAPKSTARVSTRMKASRKAYTAMEGNRINYRTIKEGDNLDVLITIRKSLERAPDEIPLNLFNSYEQLAYWINLYNLTLIEELTKVYPKTKVENALYDDLKNHLAYYADSSFTHYIDNAKRMKANIEDMSINDLAGGYKERGSGAATNTAALLDSAKAGAVLKSRDGASNKGLGPANLGAIGAIGENYASVAAEYGRFSPDMVKMLNAMKNRGETREGNVIIKESGSDSTESDSTESNSTK